MPIDKTSIKTPATSRNTAATVSMVTATSSSNDTVNAAGLQEVLQQPTFVTDDDCVFDDPVLQVSSVRVTLGVKIQMYSFLFFLLHFSDIFNLLKWLPTIIEHHSLIKGLIPHPPGRK